MRKNKFPKWGLALIIGIWCMMIAYSLNSINEISSSVASFDDYYEIRMEEINELDYPLNATEFNSLNVELLLFFTVANYVINVFYVVFIVSVFFATFFSLVLYQAIKNEPTTEERIKSLENAVFE